MHIFPTLQMYLSTGRIKNHELGSENMFSLQSPDTPESQCCGFWEEPQVRQEQTAKKHQCSPPTYTWFARSLKAKASQDDGKGSQRVKCFLPLIWNHVMWNECFSSNCFLTLTVSWCEVKVWERWGEDRGSMEW